MKFEKQIKIISMAIVVTALILLTFYFHQIQGTGRVFTHLFYIPIILGALWWGRTGTLIALFLGGMLILSHLIHRSELPGLNDYLRTVMFLLVSAMVVVIRNRMLRAESALRRQAQELENRIQAMSCLYAINRLRERPDLSLRKILGETVRILWENGRHVPGFGVRLIIGSDALTSEGFMETPDRVVQDISVDSHLAGQIELHFPALKENRPSTLAFTDEFIESVSGRLGKIIEHENARAELDRHRRHLEDRVRERTGELVKVNRQLLQEIARRKEIEISLRESEHRYRLLFENANEAIYISQDGCVRFSNAALANLSGHRMTDLMKIPLLDLIHPEDRDMVNDRYHKRLAGKDVPQSYTFRFLAKSGKTVWVEISSVRIQWQKRPATLNFLRDITARKKVEASVSQIRKMEAVGALAGGIAHKFNNALSGITGYIDLLKFTLPDNPALTRYCEAMLESAQSMTGLTHQLLAYARGGKYQSQRLSLCGLVREVLPLMIATDKKQISIDTALSPQTPQVEADAVQMQMVLLAAINNAAEAIEKRGRIRIETFDAHIDQTAAEAFAGLPPGNYAVLSITDDGKGMTEETRRRVFEPFFTTHFFGRGLGMAAAYGIIKNHGGYIYIDSEPDRGTVVHILLPPCPEVLFPGKEDQGDELILKTAGSPPSAGDGSTGPGHR